MNIFAQIVQFLGRKEILFILCAIASFFIGRYAPSLLILVIKRLFPTEVIDTYEKFINSYRQRFQWAITSILILVFLGTIQPEIYQKIYEFLNPIIEFIGRKDIQFILCVIASFFIGRYTPLLLKKAIERFFPTQVIDIYEKFIYANRKSLKWAGTLILILLSLNLISDKWFYSFLHDILELSVIFSLSLLVSGVSRQLVRTYGADFISKLGYQADDLLLILETIFNVLIGFFAFLIFANGRFDLFGLFAGFGIGGFAIAFAAQKTLEQFFGTIVIYLDRPFVTGEYIYLAQSDTFGNAIYGRVESIGFRSTKIRSAGKNTLIIIPNSILANLQVENVTRGKKVMVLLYLDFLNQKLLDKGQALVRQVVEQTMESLFGVQPDSTKVIFETLDSNNNKIIDDNSKADTSEKVDPSKTIFTTSKDSQPQHTRARITFFILGANQNSFELRKQLLNIANQKVSQELNNFGIKFKMQESNIYIEAPMTI